jgi:hypothetical protein
VDRRTVDKKNSSLASREFNAINARGRGGTRRFGVAQRGAALYIRRIDQGLIDGHSGRGLVGVFRDCSRGFRLGMLPFMDLCPGRHACVLWDGLNISHASGDAARAWFGDEGDALGEAFFKDERVGSISDPQWAKARAFLCGRGALLWFIRL